MIISAMDFDGKELNRRIKIATEDVMVENCYGERFIGTGLKEKVVVIKGTPGNALGAYLDGGNIVVRGNAQDAVGDTMNEGKIIVHGDAGDAVGYAMRGGEIFVKGNSGYRTGIHMKEYRNKKPVIVVGKEAGSFLGEYLAGGVIIVLGIGSTKVPVGSFAGTGMHGGKIFVRSTKEIKDLPKQVIAKAANEEDLREIIPYVTEFARHFGADIKELIKGQYYVLSPNSSSPYKQLYVAN